MLARIIVVTSLLVALAAHADPKAAKPHVEAGDLGYKLGKFDEALVEYSKAYELFRAPALLFNIAQCHRNLKQYERAVFFYEGYLRESPTAKNRTLVEELIRESKAELDKQQAEAAAARKAADEAQQRAAIEAQRAAAEAEARRVQEQDRRLAEARRPEDTSRPGVYRRWWFWSAIGAAAAIGGTVYYFSGDTTRVLPSGSLGDLDRR